MYNEYLLQLMLIKSWYKLHFFVNVFNDVEKIFDIPIHYCLVLLYKWKIRKPKSTLNYATSVASQFLSYSNCSSPEL